jgi:hypothetical protein
LGSDPEVTSFSPVLAWSANSAKVPVPPTNVTSMPASLSSAQVAQSDQVTWRFRFDAITF